MFECPCGERDATKFYPYLRRKCKACHYAYQREYRQRQHGLIVSKDKRYTLRKRYGMTAEAYEGLITEQQGLCAICGRDPATSSVKSHAVLHVDHDHESGRVRGLLCNSCNRALGYLRDDSVVAHAAAAYLERASAV